MKWRFTLIDKNGIATVIDEPVGWDSVVIEVNRDKEAHGIFFDYQGNDFTFYGKAYHLLKAAYDAEGVEAYYILVIEEDCGKWTELYRGRLLFLRAVWHCGPDCNVKMSMETVSDVMQLRNRWDQKVDLQTLKAFDGTALPDYEWLGKEVLLPPKTIILRNEALWTFEEINTQDMANIIPDDSGNWHYAWFNACPQWDHQNLSEIGNFAPQAAPYVTWVCDTDDNSGSNLPDCPDLFLTLEDSGDPDKAHLFFDWSNAPALVGYEANANNIDFARVIDVDMSYEMEMNVRACQILAVQKLVMIRRANGNYTILKSTVQLHEKPLSPSNPWAINDVETISDSYTATGISMTQGDMLFVVVTGLMRYANTSVNVSPNYAGFALTGKDGYVKVRSDSQMEATTSKLFMVHESLSRIAEAYTGGVIRTYSEYFGRTDSQPFVYDKDGCGSLEAITNGIFIRKKEDRVQGETALMPVSMEDMFRGLSPVHNIGFGIEMSNGHYTLRVEPWRYFYKDELLMKITRAAEVEIEVEPELYYSTFTVGYGKWETEGSSGLDEFLTKRTYRSELTTVKNEFSQLSRFIASGYAIEMTRRNHLNDNDWRYDNDTFLICMTRGGTQLMLIEFEGGTDLNILVVLPYMFDVYEAYFVPGRTVTFDGTNAGTYTVQSTSRSQNFLHVTLVQSVAAAAEWVNVTGVGIVVEQGNIDNPANMIDPATVYNYRISPVRNAMRWAPKIFESYRLTGDYIFTAGEGNIFAKGEIDKGCKIEAGVIQENTDIKASIFSNPDYATSLFYAERIKFEYPMSVDDFQKILRKPYGRIEIDNNCITASGWIESVKYEPNAGKATFVLIPQREL